MQFIGTTTWDYQGSIACKIRNKLNRYLVLPPISLDNLGDLRYVELYEDFAGQVWAKKPAGPQRLVMRPYTMVTRQVLPGTDQYTLVSKECP